MSSLADRLRRRPADCSAVADALAALAGGEEVDRRARAHVETCLHCQAELVRYRRLLRTLQALRPDTVPGGADALEDVLQTLESVSPAELARRRHRRDHDWHAEADAYRRGAYVGGMAVAAAVVAAAGVAVWAGRRRALLAD